ncbi:serine hydrolase [Pseudonocardia xishanensis]|uniref:LppW family protein n=1 Tax=Pseudonocardia xishanensis TaxID=630995 RepID=A0ABP8RNS9_9PSEU
MVVLAVAPALFLAPTTPASARGGLPAVEPPAGSPAGSAAGVEVAFGSLFGPVRSGGSTAPWAFAPRVEEPEPEPEPEPLPESGFAASAVAAAVAAAGLVQGMDLRVTVWDRELGESASAGAADEPTYTASLSKVVLAIDVVDRRRTEGLVVTARDLDLLRRALGPSDDSAMNALWSRFGGAEAASRVSARLGLTGTRDPRDPSQWGEMRVSAEDGVRLYDHVLDLPAADRDLILGALRAAPPTARDGFAQDFGLLAASVGLQAGQVAVKQGWMCCFERRYYLHSAGVVGAEARFVVALLSIQPRAGGWERARAGLTSIGEAVAATLAQAAPAD